MVVRSVPVMIALLLAGCAHGSSTTTNDDAAIAKARAGSRPIGGGPRFLPPTPNVVVAGCRSDRGRRFGAHLELFAANRVVLIPAGVGTQPPRRVEQGRITHAGCYGRVVALDATGLLWVRDDGSRVTLGDLFHDWRARLDQNGFLSFKGRIRAYVGGRRWQGNVDDIPLTRHAVVVVQVGPFVPPHDHYAFPPGA